jgi:hypothetical protein
VRLAVFEKPRPVPGRLLPAAAAAGVFALALPVFVAAKFPLGAWLIAVVLWLAGEALALLLLRVGYGADKLAASGMVGIGMTLRSVAVGVVLIAVAARDAQLGLAAAILYVIAFTVELVVSLLAYFGQEATR